MTITRIQNAVEDTLVFEHAGQRLEIVRTPEGAIQIGLFSADDVNLENPAFSASREQALELVAHLL